MKIKIGILWACIGIMGSGCRIVQPVEVPSGHYYLNGSANFAKVGKVVLLELDNITPRMELTEDLTQALADGLGKKHLFSVRTVYREDAAWQMLDLDSIHHSTNQQLAEIREKLGADAVLFGTITRYSSYPQFLIGLRLKMMDLRNGKLLWALEEVWDSTDRAVEQRIKQYFDSSIRTGYQPINWQILITSPKYFNKFVVYEVTRTLPELRLYDSPPLSSENIQYFGFIPKKLFTLTKKD